MATAFVDSPPLVQAMLTSAWNSANSDNISPTILVAGDESDTNQQKRFDISDKPVITIYPTLGKVEGSAGLGGATKHVDDFLSLDVNSAYSRSRHMKFVKELDRVLDVNLKNPIAGFSEMRHGTWKDFSDKYSRKWRHVVSIQLVQYSVTRGS